MKICHRVRKARHAASSTMPLPSHVRKKICHRQVKENGVCILGQHKGVHVELDLGRYVGWGRKVEERKLHAENNK